MELKGCGCAGFSFTDKYKQAMISLFDSVNNMGNIGIMEYSDFQNHIKNIGISDSSEVRMLIPFMLKAKIINEKNITSGGNRIRKLTINSEIFTTTGIIFIKILKLDLNKNDTKDLEIIEKINLMLKYCSFLIYLNLCNSQERIYKEIFFFIKKFNSIEHDEFYLLTTLMNENRLNKLEDFIENYRKKKIGEIKIIENVNDFQYLMATLKQFGILTKTEQKYFLSNDAKKLEINYE